jgi:hypothetical protein
VSEALAAKGRGPTRADDLAARYGPAAALTVVALALTLRLPGMFGWWVNPDEGIYLAVITQESFRLFLAEAFATAHPPLYFLILRAMTWIGTDLLWLRTLALVSGCAAVWAFVLVGRDLAGDGARGWATGLAAGLLLAVSPAGIALSQVVRPYMLLVLLLALTLHFLHRYMQRPSGDALVLQAVCASLAVLLHYSGALALGVIVGIVAVDGMGRGFSRPEWRRLIAAQALPAAIVGVLYVTQMRALMASEVPEFSVETWLSGYLIDTPRDAWLSLVGFHAALVGSMASVPVTLLTLMAIVGAAVRRRGDILVAVAGALLIAAACAALRLYPFGAGRHSAWLLPFVVPGIAWIAGSALRRPRWELALAAVVVGGLLLRAPLGADDVEPRQPEQVLRNEHVAALEALDPGRPPRLVVMSVETYRLLLPLYATDRQQARASADGSATSFRWGERDVLVLPGLDLSVRRDQMERPNHLWTGTRRAAAELGLDLPRDGEQVLVLSGDWRGSVFDLAELARQEGLSGETQIVPGLVAISLDLNAYGQALGGSGG